MQSMIAGSSTLQNSSQFPSIIHQRVQPDISDIYYDDYQIKPNDARRSVDPLELLPSELWLQAMREFILADGDAIFTLLLVSRKWHDVVVATPWLWVNIVLKDSDEAPCKIFIHQKLSNNLPLTATIVFPMPPRLYEYLDRFLAEESQRIRHLQFVDYWTGPPLDSVVNRAKEDLGTVVSTLFRHRSWPILERLEVEFARISKITPVYPSTGMPQFPSLQYLNGWSVDEMGLQQFNLENISDIQMHIPFVALLRLFPLLKNLKILRLLTPSDGSDANSSFGIPQLNWAHVTSLLYVQVGVQNILPVLKLYGQTLVNLSIKLSWGDIGDLISSLWTTSQLQFLTVWIIGNGELNIGLVPILKELKEVEFQQLDPSIASPRRTRLLLGQIPAMIPNTQTLTLGLLDVIDASYMMGAVSKLSHIRTLSLYLNISEETKVERQTERVPLPSLQNLMINNDGRFLERIEGPNLLALTYYGVHLSLKNPSASQRLRFLSLPGSIANALEGIRLPALQSLVWQTCGIGCAAATVQLSALRKVKFESYPSNIDEIDQFFETIARYPSSSCPHLEEISLPIVSNWFMLLYMLYRRNCVAKISQISTIYLTLYPGPLLLIPLTQLLAGKIPVVSKHLMECSGWTLASDASVYVLLSTNNRFY